MKKKTIQFAIAIAAFAAACDGQPNCDSAGAVATIKDMALQKINGDGYSFLGYWRELAGNTYPEHLTVQAFRKRGDVGRKGSSCAAQISIRVPGMKFSPAEMSVEYMIEPTTDGKTMVTARFQPPH